MIKIYKFNYDMGEALAIFEIDTDRFTPERAKATLEFFTWDYDYDKEGDPVDEVMNKYAMKAIEIATYNSHNLSGVISAFADLEGYCKVNGEQGIKLTAIEGVDLNEDWLMVEIKAKI